MTTWFLEASEKLIFETLSTCLKSMQTRPTGHKSVSWEAAAHVALSHQSWWEAASRLSGERREKADVRSVRAAGGPYLAVRAMNGASINRPFRKCATVRFLHLEYGISGKHNRERVSRKPSLQSGCPCARHRPPRNTFQIGNERSVVLFAECRLISPKLPSPRGQMPMCRTPLDTCCWSEGPHA